jgi:assimilatory nitrate reductase catalytic subunit
VVGHREDELPLPRRGHRASLERRAELARHDQPRARVRPDRQAKSGYGTIVGQANGRAVASTGRSAISSRLARHQQPEHRRYIAGVWGIDEQELPGPGVDAYELFRKIDRGEIKGLLSICFNPKVSLPDNAFITRCLEKLEFYAAIDFFLNDTPGTPTSCCPAACTRKTKGR